MLVRGPGCLQGALELLAEGPAAPQVLTGSLCKGLAGAGRVLVRGDGSAPPPHHPVGTQVAEGPRHLGDPPFIPAHPHCSPQGPRHLSLFCPLPTPAQAGDTRHSSHIVYLLSLTVTKGLCPGCSQARGDGTKVRG